MKNVFSKLKKHSKAVGVALLAAACLTAGTTFAKYITTVPAGKFDLNIIGSVKKEVFAVYGDYTSNGTTVKALNFYNRAMPSLGETIILEDGSKQKVTTIYTNFENVHYDARNKVPWIADDAYWYTMVVRVVDTSIAPISTAHWFYGMERATSMDFKKLDTSNVTSMADMFHLDTDAGAQLRKLDISSFDTSNVVDMEGMFQQEGSRAIETIYVSDCWNTNSVPDNTSIFASASYLTGGAGTQYQYSNSNLTYAIIDGRGGQPGYLTGIVQINVDNNFVANTGMDASQNTGSLYGITWDFNGTGDFNVGQNSTIRLHVADGHNAVLPEQVTLTSSEGGSETVDVADNGVIEIPADLMVEYTTITIAAASSSYSFYPEEEAPADAYRLELGYLGIDEEIEWWPVENDLVYETYGYDGIDAQYPYAGFDYSIGLELYDPERYTLDECAYVIIDGVEYEVWLDGSSDDWDEPTYDPRRGVLTIPAHLLTEEVQWIEIWLDAVPIA